MADVNVIVILDKSGSMEAVKGATISGFNEYLDTLKNDKENNYKLSLTLFDTKTQQIYTNKPLKDVQHLDEMYRPEGGTALYDAACETIKSVDKSYCENCKGKVKNIAVILTDGQENSSVRYNTSDFRCLIENLQGKGNWTFVYLGANQDAWANAQHWGFCMNNVSNYNNTDVGVANAFAAVARGVTLTASAADMSNKAFFSAQDKQTLEQQK